MTNELTAKLKAAAQAALPANERLSVLPPDDIFDISLAEGEQLDRDITEMNSFNDIANPANILALTEALEAAQSRIAELEARTLTVKLPTSIEPMDFAPWTAKAFWALHRDTVQRCRDSFKESCSAAGIKLQIEGE